MSANDDRQQALEQLAQGLLFFLYEVEEYRQICIRHASTTDIEDPKDGTLVITKRYRCLEDGIQKLLKIPKEPRVVIELHKRTLTVAVTAPPYIGATRPLPIRRVADALLVHESVVPGFAVEPVCVRRNKNKLWPIQKYLIRSLSSSTIPPRSALINW